MVRWPYVMLAGCGGALALVLAIEADAGIALLALPPPSPKPPSASATNEIIAVAAPPDVTDILGRPLFNWTRRPAPVASAATDGMPRLSGIMISANGRYAIFAEPSAKPLVVQEGGSVGRYTVDRIMPDHVEISGDTGPRRLQTSFGRDAPHAGSNE